MVNKMNYEDAIVSKQYNMPSEIYEKGITESQSITKNNKSIILSALFAAVIIFQVYCIAINKTRSVTMSVVVIAVCCAFIFGEWTRPKRIRKQLLWAMKKVENDTVTFNLYEDRITLFMASEEDIQGLEEQKAEVRENGGTEEDCNAVDEEWATTLNLFKKYFTITEREDLYILKDAEEMTYVVPKANFSDEEIRTMNGIFKEKMEGRFIEYNFEQEI
jgi:predicted membrane protein